MIKIECSFKIKLSSKPKLKSRRRYKTKDMIRVIEYKLIEQFTRKLSRWEKWLHKLTRFTPTLYYTFTVELTVSLNQISWVKVSDVITFTEMDTEWIVLAIDNINNTILIKNTESRSKLPELYTFIVLNSTFKH